MYDLSVICLSILVTWPYIEKFSEGSTFGNSMVMVMLAELISKYSKSWIKIHQRLVFVMTVAKKIWETPSLIYGQSNYCDFSNQLLSCLKPGSEIRHLNSAEYLMFESRAFWFQAAYFKYWSFLPDFFLMYVKTVGRSLVWSLTYETVVRIKPKLSALFQGVFWNFLAYRSRSVFRTNLNMCDRAFLQK